jgi:D-hydroxyproline dehydrogenase subunit gamma
MFKRIHNIDTDTDTVTITIQGEKIITPSSDTVAAAMLTNGFKHTRTTQVSGAHRAPFCMMGACFDCLVEIDGVPNQQACQTPVRQGMIITLQEGARDIES